MRLENVEAGNDEKYAEYREKDYGGLTALTSTMKYTPSRDAYRTNEEYQAALIAAEQNDYKTVADMEAAARSEVAEFEKKIGAQKDDLWKAVNAATKDVLRQQYESNMISKTQYDYVKGMFEFYIPMRGIREAETAEGTTEAVI